MKKSSILNSSSSPSDVDELNRATEAMKRNRIERCGMKGDVDGYLQFLEDRRELFGDIVAKRRPVVENSVIL